jgi:signal transduction histidine kinase
MALSRFQRRILVTIGFGVVLPALVLAGLAAYLTLRISQAVQDDSVRYNTYLAQQVVEAFEQELLAHLRGGIGQAETAARNGQSRSEILAALTQGNEEFPAAHFVPLEQLNDFSMLMIGSDPMAYAPGLGSHPDRYFVGLLLRDSQGNYMGSGGWWIRPRQFLASHMDEVIRERLPSNPRMYGGLESTRRLSVEVFDQQGTEIGHVRQPGDLLTARAEAFEGPFEGFTVRVAGTSSAPVVWAARFVTIEVSFIILLGAVVIAATFFGLRYTVRQLELAQMKAGFVSNVSHELKTPIALIRLAVETLEMRRISTPEESEKFLGIIARETARLSQLVDNILDFARLEAGQRLFRFESVDMVQIVADAVESLRPRLEHQGFALIVDLPDSLPQVRGDPNALTHCVLNLLDNAIKYSKNRKEIRVAAGTRNDSVWVSVQDRGIGIAQADQKRIFEKFVRAETGLVHDVKGAGLGLSLVDQIIRAHGGRVEVVSNLNEGSTFTLVLPAAGTAAAPVEEARERTAS